MNNVLYEASFKLDVSLLIPIIMLVFIALFPKLWKKLEKNTNAHYRIYQDRIYEEITESEYITFSNKNREEREQLEKSITEAERALAEIEEKIAAGDDRRARIDRYINVSKLTREIVEDLVDCIYVSKRDPGSKTLNVEIKWNL